MKHRLSTKESHFWSQATGSISRLIAVMLLALLPGVGWAQTSTTASVAGTVTDPQAAVVPGAKVELRNKETNQSQQQSANATGQYTFPSVVPGDYKLTVTMNGFRTSTIDPLTVNVARSYTVDIKLEAGNLTEVVTVAAEARLELQTSDSTVGNVIAGDRLIRLPALTRQVNELLAQQPLAAVATNALGGASPAVAGARPDQNTITLDGIDVTDNAFGGLGTNIFLPIDSIEEYRVGVATPNANFGRGAGGQVSLLGRSGAKNYHGAAFWYHQNDNLNANTWDRNRIGLKKPETKDNRFGFALGGPTPFLWEDRTFFFANYEGRRFPRSQQVDRLVPTDTLRQGILRFRDAAGNIVNYNLATSTLCGPASNTACDPRGLGLSPTISALWAKLPAGNNPNVVGVDGLNTTGFTSNARTPINNDFYNLRLDHDVTKNWHSNVAYRYFGQSQLTFNQVDITGGDAKSVRPTPVRQNMLIAGLTGQISSSLTGDFRFGWVRTRNDFNALRPNIGATQLNIPGTNTPSGFIALDIGAAQGTQSLLSEPIDVGTQVARVQNDDNRNFQWNADMNWVKGSQTFQFGSHIRYLPTLHRRDDKVFGAVGAFVAQLDAGPGSTISIPSARRPAPCAAALTTNCLQPGDVSQWDRLYTGALGLLDQVSILGVRDGAFKPLPFGTQLISDTKIWSPEFYLQDVWRIKPSLTLTLGINYGWQTPPKDKDGRQTIQIDGITGQPITAEAFLKARQDAASRGIIYNPPLGFLPINSAGRSLYDIDWHNISPRAAVAWTPNKSGGLSGKLFGDGKTVVRGGFSVIYDRTNTVQSVIIPALGVGFAQTLNIASPACNATGAGGAGCVAGSTDPALRGFRVGRDGTIPVPTVPSQSVPVIPGYPVVNNVIQFPEVFSNAVDTKIKTGRNYAVDFTIQRDLPGNMIIEAGYVGRFARRLPQQMSLGQSPFNFVDPASKQTFAQAFDNVAQALRNGQAVTPQSWFENMVPAGACAGQPNCTQWLASTQRTNFTFGSVSNIFFAIDTERLKAGLPSFNNYLARAINMRSSTGISNYNGAFVSLNKRLSRGLQFGVNYTFSRSLDEVGAVQNSAGLVPNSFNLLTEYGFSDFDRTHIFNGTWLYELPFRSSNRALKRLTEGWYVSGIYTASSGAPLIVVESAQVWGGTLFLGNAIGAVPTVSPNRFGNSVHSGVVGSGGIGTLGNPAVRGSGLNLFADPEGVHRSFRQVLISQDGRSGRANPLRGFSHWNTDAAIGKKTSITERVRMVFAADFFNIFNNAQFADPTLNLQVGSSFGVVNTQFVPANRVEGSRWIQLSLRVEF